MLPARYVQIASLLLGAAGRTQEAVQRAPTAAELSEQVGQVERGDPATRVQAWNALLKHRAAAAPFVIEAARSQGGTVNPNLFRQPTARNQLTAIPPQPAPVAKLGGRLEDWLAARFAVGVPEPISARFLGAWDRFEPDEDYVAGSTNALERLIVLCGLLGADGAEAVPHLLAILDQSGGRLGAAAWALERIGARALEPLLARLREPVTLDLPLALVIHVVGRIGRAAPVDAARALMPFLDDAVPLPRAAAFHALLQLGRAAVPELMNALRHQQPARRHLALLALCRLTRGAELASLLAEAFADPEPGIRDYATAAAGHLTLEGGLGAEHQTRLAARLVAACQAGTAAYQATVLMTLTAFGPQAAPALPLAQGMRVQGDDELRLVGLLLQARIGGPPATDALTELLARLEREPPERVPAIVTVLESVPPAALPPGAAGQLERVWSRFSAHTADAALVRASTLRVLAGLAVDTPGLRAILAEARSSVDFELSVAAGMARARLDREAFTQELLLDLQSCHSFDRRVAARLLGTLAAAGAAPALADALANEAHAPTREAMAAALARLPASRPAAR